MRLDNRVSNKHAKIRRSNITFQALTPSYAIKLIAEKASEARQEPPHEATTARIAHGCFKARYLTNRAALDRQSSA